MKGTLARVASAALITDLAASAHADHEGCMATGTGPTVVQAQCSYTAQSESQQVVVGSPNFWEITVFRQDCPRWELGCDPVLEDGCLPAEENECEPQRREDGSIITGPRTVVLLEGEGIPPGPPPTVHPRIGEEVSVFLHQDWSYGLDDMSFIAGSTGFIWVGPLDGHP